MKEKDEFKNKIALNLNYGFYSLVWYLMFVPPMLYFTLFLIYFIEGRWANHMPTISETGTIEPNTDIIAIFFSHIGIATTFCFIVVGMYVFERFKPETKAQQIFAKIGWLTFKWSGIGMVGVGLCPMNEVNTLHFLFAGSGFVASAIGQTVLFIFGFHETSLFCKIRRIIYLIIQYVGITTIGIAKYIFSNRIEDTVDTIAEYATIFFLQAFLLTYQGELKNFDISVCISSIL